LIDGIQVLLLKLYNVFSQLEFFWIEELEIISNLK